MIIQQRQVVAKYVNKMRNVYFVHALLNKNALCFNAVSHMPSSSCSHVPPYWANPVCGLKDYSTFNIVSF